MKHNLSMTISLPRTPQDPSPGRWTFYALFCGQELLNNTFRVNKKAITEVMA